MIGKKQRREDFNIISIASLVSKHLPSVKRESSYSGSGVVFSDASQEV